MKGGGTSYLLVPLKCLLPYRTCTRCMTGAVSGFDVDLNSRLESIACASGTCYNHRLPPLAFQCHSASINLASSSSFRTPSIQYRLAGAHTTLVTLHLHGV